MNAKRIVILAALAGVFASVQAQLIQTTKFGKGVNFMAKDSSMTMKFHYRMQQLFEVDYNGTTEDVETDFLVRRSRLKFSGYAFSPKLKYKAELGLTNRDISVNKEDGNGSGASRLILDAVLKWQACNHWQIWVGQTKLPGNIERVISSANLQFVNRSNLNSRFNIDRDMGIQFHGKYTLGKSFIIKPKFAFTQGEGRDITAGNIGGGFNYTGRLELLPLGNFEGKKQDYIAADITRQSKPKLMLGLTLNHNDNAVRQQGQLGVFVKDSLGNNATNDLTAIQADLHFKYNGISVMSEFAQTSGSQKIDGLSKNFHTGNAFNIQAGYVFKGCNIEPAIRFTTMSPDDEDYSDIKQTNMTTIGLSKYIVGHSLKVQTDFSYITYEGVDNADLLYRFQVEMQL